MPLVFQYGSNASKARFLGPERLAGNGRVVGTAQAQGFDIAFTVVSKRNNCAAADLVVSPNATAWGVLYEVDEQFISGPRSDGGRALVRIEGDKYERKTIDVLRHPGGQQCQATTFLVKPHERKEGLATSVKYVSFIVAGLREQQVPEDYVAHVIDIARDTNRRSSKWSEDEAKALDDLRAV